jgi:phenylpyruvate tautomerase PptA (4-oxalocrotonate tautomerase family)
MSKKKSYHPRMQMIERVTDAMVSVSGEYLRPLTLVILDENVHSGDWGIGAREDRNHGDGEGASVW